MDDQLRDKLFPHQIEGFEWIIGLEKGGILADDMGLGKTIQMIAGLQAMMKSETIRNCIIISPLSVINSWKEEFSKWAPELKVAVIHKTSKAERQKSLRSIFFDGGICITNYDQIRCNCELFKAIGVRNIVWDCIVLDEGHKLKDSTTNTFKAINSLTSKKRIMLTGTALQNNLKELYTLFSFIFGEEIFGKYSQFKSRFETPITKSRTKDANKLEKRLGEKLANELKQLIQPYYLRRTKEEIKKSSSTNFMSDIRKNDVVIWIKLSNIQSNLYRSFIKSKMVKDVCEQKLPALTLLLVLNKICNHPRLLESIDSKNQSLSKFYDDAKREYMNSSDGTDYIKFLLESTKLKFLSKLCQLLKLDQKRALIFSRSTKILDMIEATLSSYSLKLLRLDGQIANLKDRLMILDSFKNDRTYDFLLLTTQVGGVGLTITSADRVIIYDPSWNYSSDSQAVDRIYRYGQNNDVVVYRLICCSTIEEKIYRRQIFKESLFKTTACSDKNPLRYFTKDEIYTLFELGDISKSETCLLIKNLHKEESFKSQYLENHLKKLEMFEEVVGISDHDCLFSRDDVDHSLSVSELDQVADNCKKLQIADSLRHNIKNSIDDLESSFISMKINPKDNAVPPNQIKNNRFMPNRLKAAEKSVQKDYNKIKNNTIKNNCDGSNGHFSHNSSENLTHITLNDSDKDVELITFEISQECESNDMQVLNKDRSDEMKESTEDFEIQYIPYSQE